MNRIHRIVLNRATGLLQVVSEVASSGSGRAHSSTARLGAPASPCPSRLAVACAAVLSACVLMAAAPSTAQAQVFVGPVQSWDADIATPGIQGGAGDWQALTGSPNWINQGTATNTTYAQGASAVFTGTGGSITVQNAGAEPVVQSLRFDGDGYVIGGAALHTNFFTTDVQVATGATATVNSVITDDLLPSQLIKTGAGTLVLGGANTYRNGTVVSAGTLQVSADNNLGAATGSLSLNGGTLRVGGAGFTTARQVSLNGNGTLDVASPTGALTLSQGLAGAGTLTKEGTGTLVLGAAGTYTGGTSIKAGSVQTSTSGALGTGDVVVNADSSLVLGGSFTAGNQAIFTAASAGAGSNGGLLKLTDNASAGGAFITNRGSFELRNNATAGAATVDNRNGGNVTLYETATAGAAFITNGGAASQLNFLDNSSAGTSNITNGNGGLVDFFDTATASDATIDNRTGARVRIGGTTAGTSIGALSGAGNVILGSKALTTGGLNTDTTISGVISGAGGSLIKAGTGKLILAGVNTYTGGTKVNAGSLQSGTTGALGSGPVAVAADSSLVLNDSFNAGNLAISTAPSAGAGSNGGFLQLRDNASGGNAVITNRGSFEVRDTATAGNATVDNRNGGSTTFRETATAGNARITNGGTGSQLNFFDGSNAGTAVVTNASGGLVDFFDTATAGAATIDNQSGARVRISGATTGTSIGALAGDGNVILGSKALTTGGLNTSTAIGGVVSGTGGSLVKTGTGTLTLTGANTYTGGTTISGGTLAGSATSFGTGAIANNAALAIDQAADATLANTITGTGTVTKTGAGTLTLAGNNTYSGGTTVASGTLAGNAASFGTGAIANNGALRLDQATGGTLAASIGGSGGITKTGAGNLTLTGANTYAGGTTINAGTVTGSVTSFGTGAVTNNAALVLDQPTNATWTNTLTGAGSFTKAGAGQLLYTGNGTGFTGTTSVTGGALSVNGNLGGTTLVGNGATLRGTGVIGSTTLLAGATVAPGNSIGTLTVNGDFTFSPGSRYEVEANAAGQSDLLRVNGTATLGGAAVAVIAATGNYSLTTDYSILTATNRVGTFGGVTSNFAFLDPTLRYDGNNVVLNLRRNDLTFASVGTTPNQRAAAAALQSVGASPLYDVVVQSSAATAQSAFTQLAGEIHASAKTAMLEDSRFVRDASIDRLRQADGGLAAGTTATEQGGGRATWARIFGADGHIDGDGNAARLNRNIAGVMVGADTTMANGWRSGLLAGYSKSDIDVDGGGGSAKVDSYHLGLYGGTQWDATTLRLGASYTWNRLDTERSVAFTGFANRLKADYDASTAQVFGEVGRRIDMGNVAYEPFVGLAYVNVDTDGFTESGGAAALRSGGGSVDSTFSTLGVRASTRLSDTTSLRGTVGWRHAFGDRTPTNSQSFATGNAFTAAGVPLAKDVAVLEAGIETQLQKNMTLGVSYAGQFGDGLKDHGLKVALGWKF